MIRSSVRRCHKTNTLNVALFVKRIRTTIHCTAGTIEPTVMFFSFSMVVFLASGESVLKGEVRFFSHFQLELETGCPKTCSPAFRTFANTLVSDPLLIFVNTDVRSHVSDEINLK